MAEQVAGWLNRTHVGDCRQLLAQMAADGVRVQCVVTLPPYFGLRDYGTAQWEGGDEGCEHVGAARRTAAPGSGKQASNQGSNGVRSGDCACGARRVDRQIGLESTPAEFVDQMVAVFRAVREVLADDGTLWLNLGDSYASSPAGNLTPSGISQSRGKRAHTTLAEYNTQPKDWGGLPAKNLIGIPWRVAFALQADGWYLRSDIIWHKPNPMPESVTDRPTKAHEYLFLLAKAERYYYDAASIAERSAYAGEQGGIVRGTKRRAEAMGVAPTGNEKPGADWIQPETRNRRSVWTIATQSFSGAHFATFPRALIEPCIVAGARPGDTVLDPFMGSGTTGQVATDLGRQFIGCELNPEYVELHKMRRTTTGMPI